ncbi:MAG: type II secretion system GspH family protein, partial [Planctomycetes bacterium]|nr:type II secretion system GspH family protein [Planctomycetota bacterium]
MKSPLRRGLSLLEVILAVAILGLGLAIIGELIRNGTRQAEEVRFLTAAQLLCESKLEEVAAGVVPPASGSSDIRHPPFAVRMCPVDRARPWFEAIHSS